MNSHQKELFDTPPQSKPLKRPLIISASRRTDLPGFYPELCATLIKKKSKNLRTRYLYGVMFWSKHIPAFLKNPQLRALVEELDNPMLQLTITGHGGTSIEPGIQSAKQTIAQLPALISLFKNKPARILWRFDPILNIETPLKRFEYLATQLASLGINECTFSFPTYFSLKGNLRMQFEKARIPAWSGDEKKIFLESLLSVASRTGIQLKSCAQPENRAFSPDILPAACIDSTRFEALHPKQLPLCLPKDSSQRKACNCIQSEDIGDYANHLCLGGCVYCYSKAGGPMDWSRDEPMENMYK